MTVYDRTKRIRQHLTDVELEYREDDRTALNQTLHMLTREITDLVKELAE